MRAFLIALTAAAMLPGCAETEETDSAKKAKPGGGIKESHNLGPHGGKTAHLSKENGKDNHDYLWESVFKDGKLAIYILDHNDKTKTVKAEEAEISISGLKDDEGNEVPAIKLAAMEKDGQHWFEASGDAIPKGVEDEHELVGGEFSLTLGGKQLNGIFKKGDGDSHDKKHKD